MQADTAESGEVSERFEDRAIKLPAQVDFTGEAITEPKPHHVVANMSGVDDANQSLHLAYSSGAIGFSG